MDPKSYNEKYHFPEQRKDFWEAIKGWLEANPERFIAFRTYVPGYMDGEPCLPCIEFIGGAPGFLGSDFYVAKDGEVYSSDDVWDAEGNPVTDPEYLAGKEDWTYQDMMLSEDQELSSMLEDGFSQFISEWDITGYIRLVNGKPKIVDVVDYTPGF